ncbi:MAG TPA: acyltransferase [Solirubrobacteraceae bacterium]|nr:acyltransferase [Solirubrobacteraceae bacterium]
MSPGTRAKLEGFDGLRALAALSVVSYHVALSGKFARASALAPLLWELKGGVAIFFVISGALLHLPYARAIRDQAALPDWRIYARRRGVRILPAYWVALTAVAIGPFAAGVYGPDAWSYYGLSQIYDPQTVLGGLGVAWSLCVEVSFYALLPVFGWLVARHAGRAGARAAVRAQLGWIAAAGVTSLALRAALAGSLTAPFYDRGQTLMVSLPGLLDWFAIGMALAVLRAELEAGRASRFPLAVVGRRAWVCVLLAFAAFMVAIPEQHGDIFLPWYGAATHLAIGAGSGLLVLAVIVPGTAGTRPWPLRVLASPVAVWVGTISYGIYLWHFPALELIERAVLPQPASASVASLALVWLAVAAAAIVLGAASYYLVERPTQTLLRRRERRELDAASSPRPTVLADVQLPGRPGLDDQAVQARLNGLNSAGVAADHLA